MAERDACDALVQGEQGNRVTLQAERRAWSGSSVLPAGGRLG
jgi:hypothetical protein